MGIAETGFVAVPGRGEFQSGCNSYKPSERPSLAGSIAFRMTWPEFAIGRYYGGLLVAAVPLPVYLQQQVESRILASAPFRHDRSAPTRAFNNPSRPIT